MDANVVPLTRATWATPETPRDKVRPVAELAPIVDRLRQSGKTVVHAHGTFDLLHIGHVRHLEAARKLGDVLVVTLTANQFVNKGPGRPVFGEAFAAIPDDTQLAVIVTHSATAMALCAALLGLSPREPVLAPLANCHWSELRHGSRWELRAHNVGAPGPVIPRLDLEEDAPDAEA